MPNSKITFSTFLFLISIFGFSQSEDIYRANFIPQELMTKANAVVRLNDLRVVIESQDELNIVQKRIVTVLNEKGNSAIQAYTGYNKYYKIKKIEARIFNESGEEIKKIKKKDFIDHSAVDGGTLYSDSRVLFMGYTPISYPYTVEFICEIETSNTASIPNWRPIDDYYVSIQNDTYWLSDEANLGLRFKEKNFKNFSVVSSTTPNALSYTLENQQSVEPEDFGPSFAKFTPQVLVAVEHFSYYGVKGSAKNWLEYGNWVNEELLKGRSDVSEATKQDILRLTNGIEDPIAKAKAVFEFVQENTRYISVQVGIGGMQPISALEVDELKYGDCKGLTNYTQALLKVAGVESYYCIVESGKEIVDFEDDFASMEQGNHIILAIPNKDKDMVWLDCTSQLHPFNFIGDFTDNRNVLVVKPNESEIIKTKIYSDSLNYQSTNANINFDGNGNLSASIIRKTRGLQYDNRFYIERQKKEDIIEYYKEFWGYVNNLEVLNFDFNNDKENVEFTEDINVEANNYSTNTGDRMLFRPNIFNQNSFIPDRYRNRKMPLEISRGYLDEDHFTIRIPDGYEVEALPDNILIENNFGTYKFEISNNDNVISYNRTLFIKKGKYPSSAYSNYRNFRKMVSKGDNSKIVLKTIQ